MNCRVYLLTGASHMEPVGAVRKDRSVGDVLTLKGHDGPLTVVRHHPTGDILVRPSSVMPKDNATCEGCGGYMEHPTHLSPYCLSCRRQYPGQEAFGRKGDYWWPEEEGL